ncbi:MAG: bifunctional phosphopantothenoylcysteine decarboxylase/phosphopantothenate--cysteine ligase CoaBC [Candidatus Thiodiazotropha sp. (ex Gloverina cf. vestifex)]|nr:bifunctional phosphopantothenoylcysteine decarboxylase/phosphopantothenate--cysteine ligase CoaBC [Candidatus Thiodiazotropha sp. (ex Gloverina cf. vestifex)]
MSSLDNKKILLGVTGGIAAYKSAVLLRALQAAGAEVRVVMTSAAQAFVTPLTFQALSGHPVYTELLDPGQEASMDHISLARWADFILVVPATADFIARVANGHANDLLSTLCLAATVPIALAPAMNQGMWLNVATQGNIETVSGFGYQLWGPDEGDQACGETGPGRMLGPEALLAKVIDFFVPGPLQDVHVLLTAGGTQEPIDPVRFVGNRSSGRMGYALVEAMRDLGAEVTLISGPVSLLPPTGIAFHSIQTAQEMHAEVMARASDCDIFIAVAAVADYRPGEVAKEKIKKRNDSLSLEMVRNPDILADVSALDDAPFTVGFAAETEQVEAYAEAKRLAKDVDMIAANQVGSSEGGFESDRNALTLLWEGGRESLPMMNKTQLARQLADRIKTHYLKVENARNEN